MANVFGSRAFGTGARLFRQHVAPELRKQVQSFGRDFLQGAIEDEVKDRMGKPNLKTGAPSLGGGAAELLRKTILGAPIGSPAHTPRELVGQFQSLGFPLDQSVSLLACNSDSVNDATLQRIMSFGLTPPEVSVIQRERIASSAASDPLLRSAENVVLADQRLEQAKADQAKFERIANMSVSEIMVMNKTKD